MSTSRVVKDAKLEDENGEKCEEMILEDSDAEEDAESCMLKAKMFEVSIQNFSVGHLGRGKNQKTWTERLGLRPPFN